MVKRGSPARGLTLVTGSRSPSLCTCFLGCARTICGHPGLFLHLLFYLPASTNSYPLFGLQHERLHFANQVHADLLHLHRIDFTHVLHLIFPLKIDPFPEYKRLFTLLNSLSILCRIDWLHHLCKTLRNVAHIPFKMKYFLLDSLYL